MNNDKKIHRAVLASDALDVVFVLATDSPTILIDLEEISNDAFDVGIVGPKEWPGDGIHLWAGTVQWVDGVSEHVLEYKGTLRKITDMAELTALLEMTPPPELHDDESDRDSPGV